MIDASIKAATQAAIDATQTAICRMIRDPEFLASESAHLRGLVHGAYLALLKYNRTPHPVYASLAIGVALDEIAEMLRISDTEQSNGTEGVHSIAEQRMQVLRDLGDELRRIRDESEAAEIAMAEEMMS